jgi:hypothetical protein
LKYYKLKRERARPNRRTNWSKEVANPNRNNEEGTSKKKTVRNGKAPKTLLVFGGVRQQKCIFVSDVM